jgi:hypothetical protein
MATLKFTTTAGALIRGQVKREVQKYCWENDIILRTKEAKGLFESVLHFQMYGDDPAIQRAVLELKRWMRENG